MSHEVETMAYAGETPWHKLGTKVDNLMTSAEAIRAASLDWLVEQRPLAFQDAYGQWVEVDNGYANVRTKDDTFLGYSTERYEPFQIHEMFRFTDSLLQDGVMRYETAGSLFNGKRVWILCRMNNDYRIADDEYYKFILMANGNDGKFGLHMNPTETRVVCNNTLTWSIGADGKLARWSFKHTRNLRAELENARKLMEVSTETSRAFQKWAERACVEAVRASDVVRVAEALIGEPTAELANKQPRAHTRLINKHNRFINIWEQEKERTGFTAYTLVNTITGFADHGGVQLNGSKKDATMKDQRTAESMLTGKIAQFKQDGIEMVKELVRV